MSSPNGKADRRDGSALEPTERTALLGNNRNSPEPPRSVPILSSRGTASSSGGSDSDSDSRDGPSRFLAQDILSSTPPAPAGLAPEAFLGTRLRDRSHSRISRRSRRRSSTAYSRDSRPTLSSPPPKSAASEPGAISDDEYDGDLEGEEVDEANGDSQDIEHDAGRNKQQHRQPPMSFLIDTDPRSFWLAFMCVMLNNFITIFDSTIMASSHPVITSYFQASNKASWLSTTFLLTSTAAQPIVGRLSDTIGRKGPYLVAMVIFVGSTVWCALAQSMAGLIVARAVCGLGAGGMVALGSIIISDLVPIERRGIYQSYLNINYGIAAAAGAALGGMMADRLGWRWEFGVQAFPLIICFVLAVVGIPADLGLQGKRESFMQAMRAFDFLGSALLTTATTFLILGLNLGGNVLPWQHPFVIASLLIFAVSFPLFLYAESRSARPIMPLELLRRAPRANIIFSNFIANFLLNAILFNTPIFFQAVLLTSATTSGLYLIVPTTVASIMGTGAGFMIARWGRLKWPLVLGTSGYLVGSVVLCFMRGSPTNSWPVVAYLACLVPAAVGQGFQFPGSAIAVLAASEQAEQAVVTSTLVLWRALGSVLGVACSSLVLQNVLVKMLWVYVDFSGENKDPAEAERLKEELIAKVRRSVEAVAEITDPRALEQVTRAYDFAVRMTFVGCVVIAAVSLAIVLPVRLPRLGVAGKKAGGKAGGKK